MAGLSDALRATAPDMRGFTLWRTRKGWQASRQNPDGSWRVSIDLDVVEAVQGALKTPRSGAEEMLS